MESVFAQTCKEFEYIVVDGASSDDSVNVIKELESAGVKELTTFKWISEPDTGIYNAMNKGIRMSQGEYSLMLNSGDCLADTDVVERILPELQGADLIQGSMYLQTKDAKHLDYGFGGTKMSFFDVCDGDFLHQATFVHRNVYEQYGYYDESYRIAGDTAFFIKVVGMCNVSFRVVDIPISIFEGGGLASSADTKLIEARHKEFARIKQEILGERLTQLYKEDYKKVKLYDRLHAHRWIWYVVMAIVRISNIFEKAEK
jgi:glycosyltransferase involved in cell wall biosynthesis